MDVKNALKGTAGTPERLPPPTAADNTHQTRQGGRDRGDGCQWRMARVDSRYSVSALLASLNSVRTRSISSAPC